MIMREQQVREDMLLFLFLKNILRRCFVLQVDTNNFCF